MANKMKQYKIDRITTDPKFELLISPLGAEELAQLEANIRRDGIRDPLVVWPDGGSPTLLDGHNRLAIIRKINAEAVQRMAPGFVIDTVPVEFLKLPTREDAELWIAENQLGRRNLTDDQRAMLAADVLERRVKISRAESAATARAAKADPASVAVETAATEKTDTRAEVAKAAGVPVNKVRVAAALKKENPGLAKEVRTGKKTMRGAKKESKTAKRTAFLSDLKVGDWVLCARGRNAGTRGGAWTAQVTEVSADFIVVGRQRYDRKGKGLGVLSEHIERLATPAEVQSAQEDGRKSAELAAVKERAEEIIKTQVPKGYRVNVRFDRGLENPAASIDLTFSALTTEKLEHIFKVLRETAPEQTPEEEATLEEVGRRA